MLVSAETYMCNRHHKWAATFHELFLIGTGSPIELIFHMWKGNALKFLLASNGTILFPSGAQQRRKQKHIERDCEI